MVYVVTATWRAKPGKAAEVAEILARHAFETRQEPGVVTFIAHRSKDDDHEFMIYEQFVDPEALALHESAPHFRANVLEKAVPLLELRQRQYFDIIRI
jgi:quinol monooxygenase YgiN